MKRSLCCLLLTFIAACGKAPKTKPNQVINQENFTAMSSDEILQLKYDNEIDLICDLRVQEGPYVDLNYKPSKSFVWKLHQELSRGRTLEFEMRDRTYSVEVNLGSRLKVHDMEYRDLEGYRYSMVYSPTIDIRYRSTMSLKGARSLYEATDFSGESRIFENVPTVIYSLTSENMETGETISEDLRCQLRTKVRDAYRDQWIRK